jgi:hypothetical protein
LAFLDLLLVDHQGEEWDRILNRHGWIWESCCMLDSLEVSSKRRSELDRLWTLERLDARISDLASGDSRLFATAIREIRVFEQLCCIPQDRVVALDQAMEVAQRTETAPERLQLLHLMEDRDHLFPRSLNALVWKAARDRTPAIRAQALLVGPRFSASPEDTGRGSRKLWTSLLVASLQDPDSGVAAAAVIAMDSHGYGHDRGATEKLAARALQVLRKSPTLVASPRLLSACLSVLSTRPYGAENPAADRWMKILSPILGSIDPALRYKLPALALHRFPESREARQILAVLARDSAERVRWQALTQIDRLELNREDLPWLRTLLAEPAPQLQVRIMVALQRATGGELGEKAKSTLIRWAQQDFARSAEEPRAFLHAYLFFMVNSPSLPQSALDLFLSASKSTDEQLQWLARVALSAKGWLPESAANLLRSTLPAAKGEQRGNILLCLYLQALRGGRDVEASRHLSAIFEQADEVSGIGNHPPAMWLALRTGELTMAQKNSLVARLLDPSQGRIPPSTDREWRLCAKLGSAWASQKKTLEQSLGAANRKVQSKDPGWFDSVRRARGVALLLASL